MKKGDLKFPDRDFLNRKENNYPVNNREMKLQDSISETAKMVWAKLQYTECKITGEDSTVIEIKDVWGLIKEIEDIIETQRNTIDFNVKTNMDLVKTIQKMISKDKSKWEKALEWYANETNREVIEFDDYDLHVCKVAEQYHREQIREELEYEIDFSGHCKALIIINNNQLAVTKAMNGRGEGINVNDIKIQLTNK